MNRIVTLHFDFSFAVRLRTAFAKQNQPLTNKTDGRSAAPTLAGKIIPWRRRSRR